MSQAPTLADAKRAALLVIHFGRLDVAGVNEIIRQVNEEPDGPAASSRLLFAVLELYAGIVPSLHTDTGLALLNAMVVDLASVDVGGQP